MARSKFNVNTSSKSKEKRTLNGYTFSSDLEYKFYVYLLSKQEKGIVKNITIQPRYLLQKKFVKHGKIYQPIYYIPDFEVEYINGDIINFDTKGFSTPDFLLKAKIWNYVYPDKVLRVINYSKIDGNDENEGWCDVKVIEKGRKERKKAKELKNKLKKYKNKTED